MARCQVSVARISAVVGFQRNLESQHSVSRSTVTAYLGSGNIIVPGIVDRPSRNEAEVVYLLAYSWSARITAIIRPSSSAVNVGIGLDITPLAQERQFSV